MTIISKRPARPAAYIAYEHAGAKPEQALALAWLGEIFAKRSMWRPSLDAYRAGLDVADIAEVRNVYDDLREKHGFRILDYRIDNESCAILVIDNASGEIRAHVGAADYFSQERAGSIDMTEAIRSLGIEAFWTTGQDITELTRRKISTIPSRAP
jgi:hypothetical protein